MATPRPKPSISAAACCECVHARLRNLTLDRLYVRGRAKVQAWMAGFVLAMNILTEARLRGPQTA